MKLVINFSKQSVKFLGKNSHILSKDKAILLLKKSVKFLLYKQTVNLDVKALKGEYRGYYRVRYRDIRIVFGINESNEVIVLSVAAIDHRGNIYK